MDGVSLGPNITFYPPSSNPPPDPPASSTQPPSPSPPPPPTLIILCTWQGATSRHIAPLTTGYAHLFPTAAILLLRTDLADMTYRTCATIHTRLAPARALLTHHLQSHRSNPSLLLHFLSHGGLATALHLLAAAPPAGLPLHLVVADCCPGSGSFRETYRAGLASLPRPRWVQAAGLGLAVGVVYALHGAGMIRSVPGLRGALNDPRVFARGPRRLYLTSDGDGVFGAAAVVAHAREAAARGWRVGVVRFATAAHCALVREDPGRYWGAVRESWEEESGAGELPVKAKL